MNYLLSVAAASIAATVAGYSVILLNRGAGSGTHVDRDVIVLATVFIASAVASSSITWFRRRSLTRGAIMRAAIAIWCLAVAIGWGTMIATRRVYSHESMMEAK